jgi:hypothetical protein
MRRFVPVVLALVAALGVMVAPAAAITYGDPDGNAHPNVGALIADFNGADEGGLGLLCSGTLIAPNVFLTAAHCTAYLQSRGISQVWVTFDSTAEPVTQNTTLYSGTYVTNPAYTFRQSDPGDLAVVLLDTPPSGISPAQLPPAGLFDDLKASGALKDQQFTAVG